jgi:hypothetical protein
MWQQTWPTIETQCPLSCSWAWTQTPRSQNGKNLLIHALAACLWSALSARRRFFFNLWLFVEELFCVAVSLSMQTYGHLLERNQPPPFAGSRDFLRRLYAEQFWNFWRFLFAGHWYASFKARSKNG